jgi:hypothetical protein
MTIEEAASALHDRLRHVPWLTAIGVGKYRQEPCIFVYVKSPKRAETEFLKDGWQGFPVEVRKMGTPRLATDPLVK